MRRTSQGPVLARVDGRSDSRFESALAILIEGIPASEHLPKRRLAELFAGGDYCLYSLLTDGQVAGAAILYLPPHQAFVLLDYMAIRSDARGLGIGSLLFRNLIDEARSERPQAHWFLLEVDDDREGPEELRLLNRRRISFYQRLGAKLLTNFPYRFPSPSGAEVPMRLMVVPLREASTPSSQDVLTAIGHIFKNIHKREGRDPLLQWIEEEAPAVVALG
jgi:GNAT superfamily N-acetyltransferase